LRKARSVPFVRCLAQLDVAGLDITLFEDRHLLSGTRQPRLQLKRNRRRNGKDDIDP